MSGRPASSVSSSRKPVTTGRWKPGRQPAGERQQLQRDAEQQDEEQPQRNSGSDSSTIDADVGDGFARACRAT